MRPVDFKDEFYDRDPLSSNNDLYDVVVPKGTLVCEHPLDKRASFKSHGKDFCWKCGDYITN
jgi:hypothetical protein